MNSDSPKELRRSDPYQTMEVPIAKRACRMTLTPATAQLVNFRTRLKSHSGGPLEMTRADSTQVVTHHIERILQSHFRRQPIGEIRALYHEILKYSHDKISLWLSQGKPNGPNTLLTALAMQLTQLLSAGGCECAALYAHRREVWYHNAIQRCKINHRITDLPAFAQQLELEAGNGKAGQWLINAIIGSAKPYSSDIGRSLFTQSMLFKLVDTPLDGKLDWETKYLGEDGKGTSVKHIFEVRERIVSVLSEKAKANTAQPDPWDDTPHPWILWCRDCDAAVTTETGCGDFGHANWTIKRTSLQYVSSQRLDIYVRKCPDGHVWSGHSGSAKACPVPECGMIPRPGFKRQRLSVYVPKDNVSPDLLLEG